MFQRNYVGKKFEIDRSRAEGKPALMNEGLFRGEEEERGL